MTAATIAPAQESAAKLPAPKLPSNPFAGKQYLGLILPLASLITGHNVTEVLVTIGVIVVVFGAGIIPLARHLWNTPSNAPVTHLPERTDREAVVEAAIDRYSRTFGSDRRISKEQ